MTAETTTSEGIVLTDAAASKVKALLEAEGRDDLTLRIAVQPGGCSGLRYQLFFDDRSLDGDVTKEAVVLGALVTVLLLTLLGVPWDDVMEDYLRTNELWTGHIGRYPELDIDTRAAIVEARTPYLEAAFEVVRADFGGPEQFAERALGLDASARERIRALSIPDALLLQSEASGVAQARFTVAAPVGGVIAELGVRDGVAVTPGMTLFRIAGLERVWVVAEVPEAQAMNLRRGQKARATSQVDASQSFEGQLKEILPQVNANSRTVQARFDVPNPGGRLVPGMLLRLQVSGPTTTRLLVQTEAVIRTGTRAVVIARKDNGAFEPREVSLGTDLGDQLEVLGGLQEGEKVVVSGQFLVDSEARLKSVLGSMSAPSGQEAVSGPTKEPEAVGTFTAQGKVEDIDAEGVTISHGPVPALKWPSMTMGFGKTKPTDFPGLKTGDTIQFQFKKGGAMGWELLSVQPTGAKK